jgi:hypothetical protein
VDRRSSVIDIHCGQGFYGFMSIFKDCYCWLSYLDGVAAVEGMVGIIIRVALLLELLFGAEDT